MWEMGRKGVLENLFREMPSLNPFTQLNVLCLSEVNTPSDNTQGNESTFIQLDILKAQHRLLNSAIHSSRSSLTSDNPPTDYLQNRIFETIKTTGS